MTKLDGRLKCKEKTRMGIKNTIYGLIPVKIFKIESQLELVYISIQNSFHFVLNHFP